jgi:hypothetical protein
MATELQRGFRRVIASSAVLGAFLGLGGCFQDHFMGTGDDGLLPASATEAEPGSTTGGEPLETSGVDTSSGSIGDDGSTTTPLMADESTSTGTGGDDESESEGESSGSTGAPLDESTGTETVLGVNELQPGDLVVTEVMWNPGCTGDACEWIEILNATALPVNLLDLYVQDIDQNAGNQGRVIADVIVEPGGLAVITRGVSFWPYDFTPAAVYGPNPGLNNDSPESVVLRNDTEILDETATFIGVGGVGAGVAWSLSGDMLDAVSNDASVSWCGSTAALNTVSTIEYGSPGVLNEGCAG